MTLSDRLAKLPAQALELAIKVYFASILIGITLGTILVSGLVLTAIALQVINLLK